MPKNLSFRCEFEEDCDALKPLFKLMEKLDKKTIDHTFLKGAYEVFLKHYCNDSLKCKRCPNYQKYSKENPRKLIHNTGCTSADGDVFDTQGWRK